MKIPTSQLVRVSTQEQADNTSLADQRKEIKSYCIAMGHELVFEEVGSSKNTTDRPLFTKALEAFRYRADGIIAAKLDRVARNTRDVLELVEDVLQPENKALILLDLQVDTSTPMGTLILTVSMSKATQQNGVVSGLVVLCLRSVNGCKCHRCGDLPMTSESPILNYSA